MPTSVFADDAKCKKLIAVQLVNGLMVEKRTSGWEEVVAKILLQNPDCDSYSITGKKNVDLSGSSIAPLQGLKIDWTLVAQYKSAFKNTPEYARYGIAFIESDGALGIGVVAGGSVAAALGAVYLVPAGLAAVGVGSVATAGVPLAGAGVLGMAASNAAVATAVGTASGLGATTVGGIAAGVVGGTGTMAAIGGTATVIGTGTAAGVVTGQANGLMRYNQLDEVIKNSRTWSNYSGCFNTCDGAGMTMNTTDLLTNYVMRGLYKNTDRYCVNNNEGKLNLLYNNGAPIVLTKEQGSQILSSIAANIADKGKCDGHLFDMDAYLVQYLYDDDGNMLPKYIIASDPVHIDD